MRRSTRNLAILAVLAVSLLVPASAFAVSAVPADHIGGAAATWSQSTDGIRTSTGFLPELLGFRYDLALTVFESADAWERVPLRSRAAAYRTGRLEPGLYFHADPGGEAVLAEQIRWYTGAFGTPPSALSYRLGTDRYRAIVPRYVFGARNSQPSLGTGYGASREASGTPLGAPGTTFGVDYLGSIANTTRVFDGADWAFLADGSPNPLYGASLSASLSAADQALGQAIQMRGWYTDFTHWSTPSGPQLNEYFARQSSVMKRSGTSVARASYGDAVTHRFLRDSTTCTLSEPETGTLAVGVTFTPAYPDAPIGVVRQPVAVLLETWDSTLAGFEIAALGAQVRRLATNRYALLVPFSSQGSTVTVTRASKIAYLPERPPVISATVHSGILRVSTDRPSKVALFVASADLARAPCADVLWRSSQFSAMHQVDLRAPGQSVGGDAPVVRRGNRVALYLGAIGPEGHSSAVRVSLPSSATRLSAGGGRSVPYDGAGAITARLTDGRYAPLTGQVVVVDVLSGTRWVQVARAVPVLGQPGRYQATVRPYFGRRTLFRFRYLGLSGTYSSSVSAGIPVLPRVSLTIPSLDRSPRRGTPFVVSGLLTPRHRPGSQPVVLEFFRLERSSSGVYHWIKRRPSFSPRVADYRQSSRYAAKVPVPLRGQWMVRARHPADWFHAETVSAARRFAVR